MRNQRLILRLDDAAERMDIEKWERMEALLDAYHIKPLVGVIPDCRDPMMEKYAKDDGFWDKVLDWIDKGWTIALHGCTHVYDSKDGGINQVNCFSEFAGHSYELQAERIRRGIEILKLKGIEPAFFFAPGHTFDENTLKALKAESNIRAISDTPAWDAYQKNGFVFIPQQSGKVRKLPFATVTYCYHPNIMEDKDFLELEFYLKKYGEEFCEIEKVLDSKRKYSILDRIVSAVYFLRRKFMIG